MVLWMCVFLVATEVERTPFATRGMLPHRMERVDEGRCRREETPRPPMKEYLCVNVLRRRHFSQHCPVHLGCLVDHVLNTEAGQHLLTGG